MGNTILNITFVNKFTIIVCWLGIFLASLPDIFTNKIYNACLVLIVGSITTLIPITIIYFIKKDSICIRYLVSNGPITLVFTMLYLQNGVIDNLFWIYIGLVSASIFFDRILTFTTSIITIVLAISLYIFNKPLFFPLLTIDNFIQYCLSLLIVGTTLAGISAFGKSLILKSEKKSIEALELVNVLEKLIEKSNYSSNSIRMSMVNINKDVFKTRTQTEKISSNITSVNSSLNELHLSAATLSSFYSNVFSLVEKTKFNADIMLSQSEFAHKTTLSGQETMHNLISNSSSFENNMTTIIDTISNLSYDSREINNVSSFINDISKTIKLLSLNASIEAAKSGDAGKGFAVVANEIKKLSERSTIASRDIQNLLAKISNYIKELNSQIEENRKSVNSSIESNKLAFIYFTGVLESIEKIRRNTDFVIKDTYSLYEESSSFLSGIKDISEFSKKCVSAVDDILLSTNIQKNDLNNIEHQTLHLSDLWNELNSLICEGEKIN